MGNQPDKTKELLALVQGLTHKLGNLMVGIVGNGDLMLEENLVTSAEGKELIKEMVQCAEHATELGHQALLQAINISSDKPGEARPLLVEKEVTTGNGQDIAARPSEAHGPAYAHKPR